MAVWHPNPSTIKKTDWNIRTFGVITLLHIRKQKGRKASSTYFLLIRIEENVFTRSAAQMGPWMMWRREVSALIQQLQERRKRN
jgi:hypothetical protein